MLLILETQLRPCYHEFLVIYHEIAFDGYKLL